MNNILFDEIDQIVNIDIMGRKNRKLYLSAKKSTPLCLESAEIIFKCIRENATAFIASGFPIIPHIKPETDGPIGAVILARALENFGIRTIFITDNISLDLHKILATEVGIKPDFICVPINHSEAKELCHSVLLKYKPSFMVAVERPGINHEGIYCNMRGDDISSYVGKIDYMFNEAFKAGIPTIGVGDGGNEIGMGNIYQSITKILPLGSLIASKTKTSSLVVSAVSNWGVYGIVSALSILTGFQLMHEASLEKHLIETCIKSGALDGITKKSSYAVDGIPSDFHEHIVEILNYLAKEGISKKWNI